MRKYIIRVLTSLPTNFMTEDQVINFKFHSYSKSLKEICTATYQQTGYGVMLTLKIEKYFKFWNFEMDLSTAKTGEILILCSWTWDHSFCRFTWIFQNLLFCRPEHCLSKISCEGQVSTPCIICAHWFVTFQWLTHFMNHSWTEN